MSPETPPIGFSPHRLGLNPNPLAVVVLMADGGENPKLATARPPLDPMRMGHLVNSPCYSLAQGIRLRSLELVIMKGRESGASPLLHHVKRPR